MEMRLNFDLYARRGYPTFNASQQEELVLQALCPGIAARAAKGIRPSVPDSLAAALRQDRVSGAHPTVPWSEAMSVPG